MKKIIPFLLLFYIASLQAQTSSSKQFFELKQSLDEVKKEMEELKRQVREYQIRMSIPEIRKEINRLIQIPEMTHEIILKNGTVVKGKIVYEDIDRIIVETQIGQLTLEKSNIRETRKADLPHAKLEFDGPVHEEVYPDKRVFQGKIKNTGIRRADFPRIIFTLHDETTNIVARDSIFASGKFHMYRSGVMTDSTLEPGETVEFTVTVQHPEDAVISYYTKKINWQEFE